MRAGEMLLLRCAELLVIEPRIRQFAIPPGSEMALHDWGNISFQGVEPPRLIHGVPYVVAALPEGVIRCTT